MQAYGAPDLARSFRTVRKNTITIAEDIPEEQYAFRAAPGVRTVAETLAHIAVAPRWPAQAHAARLTFIDFPAFSAAMEQQARDEAALTTKTQIVDALRREGDAFAAWLETLSDAGLAERVGFPPPVEPSSRTRFEMLLSVKEHEMHHRGQLMLVERLLGIVPHLTRAFQERAAQRQRQTPEPSVSQHADR